MYGIAITNKIKVAQGIDGGHRLCHIDISITVMDDKEDQMEKIIEALRLAAVATRAETAAKAARLLAVEALAAAGLTPAPGCKFEAPNGVVQGTTASVPEMIAVPAIMLSTALRDGLVKPDWRVLDASFPGTVTYTPGVGPLRFRPDRDA